MCAVSYALSADEDSGRAEPLLLYFIADTDNHNWLESEFFSLEIGTTILMKWLSLCDHLHI